MSQLLNGTPKRKVIIHTKVSISRFIATNASLERNENVIYSLHEPDKIILTVHIRIPWSSSYTPAGQRSGAAAGGAWRCDVYPAPVHGHRGRRLTATAGLAPCAGDSGGSGSGGRPVVLPGESHRL